MPVAGLISQGASAMMGQIGGIAQMGIGFIGGRRARKQLGQHEQQSPVYSQSKSINDYYSQALNRYSQSPYQSNLYKMQSQQIGRGTAQGIAGLQDRRSALAGMSGLIQNQNDALLKAGAAAEQQQDQRFGQVGAATQMKAGEERQAFNINKMMPFERRYNQLAQKAAGYNQMFNAGLSNYFGGVQSGAMAAGGAAGSSGGGYTNMMSGGGDYQVQDRYLPPSTYKVPLASY